MGEIRVVVCLKNKEGMKTQEKSSHMKGHGQSNKI
jgi:hypothetical protein